MQSLLTAVIVLFGFAIVQPHHRWSTDQTINGNMVKENKIQDNFRSLFDSIGKNNVQKTEKFRGILEEEAANEQQAFDSMKAELRVARRKNVNKQRSSNRNRIIGQNVVPWKREISDENRGPAGAVGNNNEQLPHTANMRRSFPKCPTVPEGSHPSSQEEVKTDYKRVPNPGATFETIQRDGFRLVDKTKFIRKLMDTTVGVYLLTRPRRTGKTVFLGMLKEFLEGRKDMFNGTDIQSRGNGIKAEDGTWEPYPVILVDFYDMRGSSAQEFITNLQKRLQAIADMHGVSMPDHFKTWDLDDLIDKIYDSTHKLVSVLIDNYDAPLMEPYTSEADNELLLDALENFYFSLKPCTDRLRIVFITGVSRMNKVDRAWNGYVKDITHEKDFWSMIGFTWNEVRNNFDRNIGELANAKNMPRAVIENQMSNMYGFYKFALDEPTGVLLSGSLCESLKQKEVKFYLPNAPAFDYVVDQMLKRNLTVDEFKYVEVPTEYFNPHTLVLSPMNGRSLPLQYYMWFNGFLTIMKRTTKRDKTFLLTYPSIGVEEHFRKVLHRYLGPLNEFNNETLKSVFRRALIEEDFQSAVNFVNKHAFPEVAASLNQKLGDKEEFAATHQVFSILKSTFQVNPKEGEHVFKPGGVIDGDIDLFIPPVEDNGYSYTISMKYEKDVVTALMVNIAYIVETRATGSFKSATSSTDSMLFGWNVRRDKKTLRRSIVEWAAVPYRNGKIGLDELQSDSTSSGTRLLENLKKRIRERPTILNKETKEREYPEFDPDCGIIVGLNGNVE